MTKLIMATVMLFSVSTLAGTACNQRSQVGMNAPTAFKAKTNANNKTGSKAAVGQQ